MNKFTADELAHMQATQTGAMQDTCSIGVYSMTRDSYGAEIAVYTYGADLFCGYDPTGGRESRRATMTPLDVSATVRLPIGTSISRRDRIKIKKRFGVAISPEIVLSIVSEPERGPSGLVIMADEVTL